MDQGNLCEVWEKKEMSSLVLSELVELPFPNRTNGHSKEIEYTRNNGQRWIIIRLIMKSYSSVKLQTNYRDPTF